MLQTDLIYTVLGRFSNTSWWYLRGESCLEHWRKFTTWWAWYDSHAGQQLNPLFHCFCLTFCKLFFNILFIGCWSPLAKLQSLIRLVLCSRGVCAEKEPKFELAKNPYSTLNININATLLFLLPFFCEMNSTIWNVLYIHKITIKSSQICLNL